MRNHTIGSLRIEFSIQICLVVFQSLSCIQLFETPWTAAHQASLSFTISQSLLKLKSIESVMPSNHLILCCLPLPTLNLSQQQGLFQWVSSSHQVAEILELQFQHHSFQWIFRTDFLPMNIQDWFPLGSTGWSPCSSRDSRVFSDTAFKSVNTLAVSFLYGPNLTSIHDCWKNHSFD